MDNNLIEIFSPIDAIYLSESFCEMMNSQSCDCDSLVIKCRNEFILLNYINRGDNGYIEWESLFPFDANAYPYEVKITDKIFKFDRVSYSEEGFVEGVRFSADGVFLFIFGSKHNLILTISKYDLFEDVKMDFPETEAVLQIISRKENTYDCSVC